MSPARGRAGSRVFDAVYKHDDPRPFGQGDLTLQGEFLYRGRNQSGVTTDAPLAGIPRSIKQTGFYVQAVYGFLPRFQAGVRYDMAGGVNRLDGRRPRRRASETFSASRRR